MDNREIIEKATMVLSDLATGSGRMSPDQADTFIRKIQAAPTLLKDVRMEPMNSDSQRFPIIGFGQRVLRPAVEGVALEDSQKAKPTADSIILNAKEVIAEINLTYDVIENNIEKGRFRDSIMDMLAERAALDIEELVLNGDKSSDDAYLALIDGLRKQAASQHVIDFKAAELTKDAFKQGYAAVPPQYLRNPREWAFYTSHLAQLEWIDYLTSRGTGLGDTALTNGGNINAYGVPIKPVAMMQPYDAGVDMENATVSDILLTHPKNILVGMSRNMTIEVEKDIRARKFIIVLTAKLDAVFEEKDATALVTHVKA